MTFGSSQKIYKERNEAQLSKAGYAYTYPAMHMHRFANFRTAMEFKFTEANVMDVINAVSVELHEYRIKIFTLKNSIIYGLLTNALEKNHAHIGAVAIGDGLTAWKNLLAYVAVMIIESSGGSKTNFLT